MSRVSTAAVIRDNTQYVFVTRPLNAETDTIVSMASSIDAETGGREFIEVGGDNIRVVKNSPLAATLSVDKVAINIYYFEQTKNGIILQEASQKGREPYIETGLGDFLVSKKVFPHPTSTIAACTANGKVSVWFRAATDSDQWMTLARFDFSVKGQGWQLKKMMT